MNASTKHRLAGILIIIACIAAVAGTRVSKNTGTALLDEPAKTHGPAEAPIHIAVFSDFECPYCSMFAPVLKKIHEAYPNDVKIIFKHFPLGMHKWAVPAAEASECAADQGKFWQFHDLVFEKQDVWAQTENPVIAFKEYAKTLGLDTAKFDACLDGGSKKPLIKQNKAEGKKFMISGTPTALLNLKKYIVSMDEEGIKKTIDEELKKAGKK